jgi:hypothetical protein
MRCSPRVSAVLALMSIALAPAPGEAQASGLLNGAGYAFFGGATGVMATANATCEGGFICIPAEMVAAGTLGLVAGMAVGIGLSNSANRAVAEGRPVSGGHLTALVVGTMIGSTTLGAIASGVLVDDGVPGGIVGAVWGAHKLGSNWLELTGRHDANGFRLEVTPGAMVHGRPGILLSARF